MSNERDMASNERHLSVFERPCMIVYKPMLFNDGSVDVQLSYSVPSMDDLERLRILDIYIYMPTIG